MFTDWFDYPLDSVGLFLPVVVSFGGGLNSTAVLVEWARKGYHPPDKIVFADTGGERPATYAHVAAFDEWLVAQGFPGIEITRKGGRVETLEENCLRHAMLPSLAYGKKGCSHKFKIEPQERDINRWPEARTAWRRNEKVMKILGYGYEEQRRIALAKIEDEKYLYRFPLNEWRMDRGACTSAIKAAGLAPPPKSSCFFCPASTLPEIRRLAETSPDLIARALALETAAHEAGNLKTVKGLGRRFSWKGALQENSVAEDTAGDVAPCIVCIDQ